MYYLAYVFPFLNRYKMPVNRDQVMLLIVAINEIFLGIDHFFAHLISGTIRSSEALPIVFGPVAGILLILAGLASYKWRTPASIFASIILIAGIFIGIIGWVYHFIRATNLWGEPGSRITIELFIWSPPILGPLTASLVGLLGLLSLWKEKPLDSGNLIILGKNLKMPVSKAQAYFLLVGFGVLATLISSVLDHARTGFENPWLWVPVAGGVFGAAAGVLFGLTNNPSRADVLGFILIMLTLIAIGVVGAALHVKENYEAANRIFTMERMIRGAPFMAPLLFADMGTIGLVSLMDPQSKR